MKRIYSILLFPITVSVACAIGLDDVYTNTDVYATFADYDVEAIAKKPDSGGGSGDDVGSGDVVTSPGIQLGLPKGDYVEVEGMVTSGLGTSQDVANVITQLQSSLDANADKNDLMHWYVTAGTDVIYHTPNSFRCKYNPTNGERTSLVMALWLPQDASSISLNFLSYSRGMSISIWTYDYKMEVIENEGERMLYHYASNNEFNNPKAPGEAFVFSETYEMGKDKVVGPYTGQYLIVMFNTANKEDTWLDINGLGVSYSTELLSDDYENPLEKNPFQEDVGYNIIGYDDDYPIVPEPTTATLSLLALAGLAARRRRK